MGLFLIILGFIIAIVTIVLVVCAGLSFDDDAQRGGLVVLGVGVVLSLLCFFGVSTLAPSKWTTQTGTISYVTISGDPNTVWITLTDTSNDYKCSGPVCLSLNPGDDVSFESGTPGYAFIKGSPVVRNIALTG